MKNPLLPLTLGAGLALSPIAESASAKTITIPGRVVSCYQSLASEILAGDVSRHDVERYVNPENVLRDMRLDVSDAMKEKVITSALNFAHFIVKRVQSEGGTYTANDVQFNQYKAWSHKLLLGGNIGGKYSFKLYLEPTGCKVLNFSVEGLKSMRDSIPQR